MSGSYTYVTPSGVIVPDTGTLQTEVDSEWIGVFGTGLNTDSSTPQGVIIASDVNVRSEVLQNNAALANQINPNQAGGIFLDAICALSGLEREANTFTTVPNVVLAGVQSSPIAAGSIATTPAGDQFELEANVTLDATTGLATGTFVALVAGPVPAPSGTWTPSPVLGWETVTNPVTAVPGTTEQSDQSLRALRRVTLALQGVSIMEAILSAVNDTSGVIGSQGRENQTGTTVVIGGVTLVPHSVWVVADGGTDIAIGTALLENKSSGSAWNGATTVNVTEPASGQVYAVKFDRPTAVPLLVRVTCSQASFVGNVDVAVVQAVTDFANNAIPGLQGWTVGENASPFEVGAAIMQECQGLYVSKVELTLASSVNYQPAEIAMLLYQKATLSGGGSGVTVIIV